MRTHGLFSTRPHGWRILAALASMALALPAQASFHFMQIEQVIGGVNGDTTAQAVQLRMRFAGQTEVDGAELVAVDAAGNNPITLATFPTVVSGGGAGSRILITTASFASYQATPISSDFVMEAIPASYLAAGRLAFQKFGIRWSVSWGGAGYTGPNMIVLGQNPLRVIVRALGPSLPVPGALENPVLELRDGDGNLVDDNDDWREDPAQESEIIATGIPPTNNLESAIVRDLAPGQYTAIVRGANNTIGVAIVEAYGLS